MCVFNSMTTNNIQLPDELIFRKIFVMRQHKVMLDSDLAELYDVNTKRLNEQVKRNPERFPQDFMFQLTQEEWSILKSQNATSRWGGRRTLPYVFTEHGVLMLSSVLTRLITFYVLFLQDSVSMFSISSVPVAVV